MRAMTRVGLAAAATGAMVTPCLIAAGGVLPVAASASTIAPRILPAHTTPTPKGPHLHRRPNILLITADDASILDMRHMPHVRKLIGNHGVTFNDALAPTPICVPARASLLTGQYANNTGTVTISGPRGGFKSFNEHRTLPIALHRAGYQTLFTGKYLNGYGHKRAKYVPPGWTDWRATAHGTYNFFHQVLNINGHLHHVHRYTTSTMRDQADQMIRKHGKHKRPWYLWVNYVAPHTGGPVQKGDPKRKFRHTKAAYKTTVPAPHDMNRFRHIKLPKRPDMFWRHVKDLPHHSPGRRHISHKQKLGLRIEYERRIEALQGVDRAVASQIRTLRRTHQLRNTVVIFTSDNGFVTGEHNIEGKLWYYNEIVRIPALARGPGIPHHKVVNTAITNPDIAATIMAIAKARPLRRVDGVNMLPWLNAPTQVRITPIRGWAVHNGRRQMYAGVRVGPWTYIRLHSGGLEMYDRRSDPYELHNLARKAKYRTERKELAALTHRYLNCKGSGCPKQFYPASQQPKA